MNDNQNNRTFQYTYSAKEQEELRRIRSKYIPREENKLELLRRLDGQVTRRATAYALIAGITGTLIFGAGMSMCLTLGDAFTIPGVIVGVIGLVAAALACPLYEITPKRERARIAPEILRLTEDLMK